MQSAASFNVVHLHRLGSCQGRLVVSRDGIAFVPESETSADGFTLKHSDFLPTLEDNRLTIQSTNRTYRFRAADGAGEAGGAPIGTVIESLARFR